VFRAKRWHNVPQNGGHKAMTTSVTGWVGRAADLFRAHRYDALAHERLRFRALLLIAVTKLCTIFGGNWDVQWHLSIGRDTLWIPPHVLALAAYASGAAVLLAALFYEKYLDRAGVKLEHVVRVRGLRAPGAYYGLFLGYLGITLATGGDELWHRAFGLDATLWSPPHLAIMFSSLLIDLSLMLGLSASAARLGLRCTPRSPFFWGVLLTGAFTFEAVNFQATEAFVAGFRVHGVGVYGILYPILVGALFPFPLTMVIKISRRYWIAILVCLVGIAIQYTGTALAALGFAILHPVSGMEEFIATHPDSTIALARQLITLSGYSGLVGPAQAWAMWLSAPPLLLVSLLHWWPWARRNTWSAAVVYSAAVVPVAYLAIQQVPVMRAYGTTAGDLALGVLLAVLGGLGSSRAGEWLARFGEAEA
jgi:hypothetical protein